MRSRTALAGACLVLVFGLVTIAGCASGSESSTSGSAVAPAPPATAAQGGSNGSASTGSSSDRLVIESASMQVQVDDLAGAIASLRGLTQKVGGSVSQLTVRSDSESAAPNTPHSASETVPIPGPASASLTLRLPAASLPDVEDRAGALGRLVSQSSNESDVTQKHVDLSARLANSQAEEVRLRGLLARAGTVSDLLQVEREMSRVQGDVESMQAQLAYLDSQIAMATLTVSLDEPGPIVRPSAGGWGFFGAVTHGVQGAAALLRAMVTALITLSPLLVLGALAWWFLSLFFRRRRARREAGAAHPGQQPGSAVPPAALDEEARRGQQP